MYNAESVRRCGRRRGSTSSSKSRSTEKIKKVSGSWQRHRRCGERFRAPAQRRRLRRLTITSIRATAPQKGSVELRKPGHAEEKDHDEDESNSAGFGRCRSRTGKRAGADEDGRQAAGRCVTESEVEARRRQTALACAARLQHDRQRADQARKAKRFDVSRPRACLPRAVADGQRFGESRGDATRHYEDEVIGRRCQEQGSARPCGRPAPRNCGPS